MVDFLSCRLISGVQGAAAGGSMLRILELML